MNERKNRRSGNPAVSKMVEDLYFLLNVTYRAFAERTTTIHAVFDGFILGLLVTSLLVSWTLRILK